MQDAWQDLPVASYPQKLGEAVLKGMRVLADVAIRTYMKERAARSDHANNGVGKDNQYTAESRATTEAPQADVKGGVILGHGAEQKCTTRASAFSINITLRRVSAGAVNWSECGGV